MAITLSRSRVAPIVIKTESAYGTDPTPVMGTDDILSYDSPVPHALNVSRLELRPHGNSLTRTTDIIAQRYGQVRFKTMWAGSGSAGTIAVNGFKAFAAALGACGTVVEVATGTPTKLRVRPSTVSEWEGDSVTVWTNHNGYIHELNGAYGDVTLTGTPRGSLECDFTFTGLYVDPVAVSTTFDNWTGGTNRGKAFLGISATITPSGGSAYTGIIESFTWRYGNTITPIDDANSSTGTWGILNVDKSPMITMRIAQDNTGTNLTYPNLFTQLFASTTHTLTFTHGTGTGNSSNFFFPQLQLVNITPTDNAGHRAIDLEYKVTGGTAESEFYCYIS